MGRGRELLEIRRLLAVAHTVTLTGPGGIGKSRLALRASHQLARHYPQGVWWVELADVVVPDLTVQALVHCLQVHERPDAGIVDSLLAHLRERRLLLVLDNCEHLVDACRDLVTAIVSRCDGVRVLGTSRQRLGVPGESIVVVAPLDIPDEQSPGRAAMGGDAVSLLMDRARALAPDFAPSDEDRATAIEICRRLDGMPLAIELAAVRLASMSAQDLLDRLDDRFRLLTDEQRSSRRQALRATVEWSHDTLGVDEQVLWRRLSVFAGGFGIDAAESVCAGDGLGPDRIVDLIRSLVDRSILVMMRSGHRSRYRLLETMRLYGAERLRDAGDETALRRRHAAWCLELLSDGDEPWWGNGAHADLVDVLDDEWANIQAALAFCALSAHDAPTGLRLATDLWPYWMLRSNYRKGCRHLERFLEMTDASDPRRVMALWALGWLATAVGNDDAAQRAFEDADEMSRVCGGERERAFVLLGLGVVHLRRGELELACERLAAARDLVDHRVARTLPSMYLSIALAIGGALPEALDVAQAGYDATEPDGDTMLRGVLAATLGMIDCLLDDAASAEARLRDGARIAGRLGHMWGLTNSLDGLAWVAASSGAVELAAQLLGAVASLWDELGMAPVPYWRSHHDGCEASVRAALPAPRFRTAWEHGYALDRAGMVALALGELLPAARGASRAAHDDALELSARELEVARLVADGLTNPAIALALFVSTATVKTHVSHILQKLALDSRDQLARWVAAHAEVPSPVPGS